eukprot:GHVO01064374.1.p1 GENE.GHVO01064374.1~~GHVO01064374.1.p1  ORF type:complete len:155 (+),score=1.09 GHVO01064374.1:812-1276(+)
MQRYIVCFTKPYTVTIGRRPFIPPQASFCRFTTHTEIRISYFFAPELNKILKDRFKCMVILVYGVFHSSLNVLFPIIDRVCLLLVNNAASLSTHFPRDSFPPQNHLPVSTCTLFELCLAATVITQNNPDKKLLVFLYYIVFFYSYGTSDNIIHF